MYVIVKHVLAGRPLIDGAHRAIGEFDVSNNRVWHLCSGRVARHARA